MKQDNLMQDLLTHPAYSDYPGNIWHNNTKKEEQYVPRNKTENNPTTPNDHSVVIHHSENRDYMSRQYTSSKIDTTGLTILVIAAVVIAAVVIAAAVFWINRPQNKRIRF